MMNIKKCITMAAVIFMTILTTYNNVFASANIDGDVEMDTEFEVKDYDNYERFISAISLKLINSDCNGADIKGIHCFDVNENGNIAVAFESQMKKHICIYNSYGEFQYGYSLVDYGSIGVEWSGDNVIVYFERGNNLMLIDRYANVLDIKEALYTSKNNSYRNNVVFSREKTVGDYTYKLKGGKITKTDAEGNKQIIVDRSKNYNIHNLLMLLCFVVMATIVTIGLVKLLIQYRR